MLSAMWSWLKTLAGKIKPAEKAAAEARAADLAGAENAEWLAGGPDIFPQVTSMAHANGGDILTVMHNEGLEASCGQAWTTRWGGV